MVLYTTAMALIPCIVPFTLALMRGTNEKLMVKARGEGKAENARSDSETRELLAKWRKLNYGRAAMVLLGSVLACVATVLR